MSSLVDRRQGHIFEAKQPGLRHTSTAKLHFYGCYYVEPLGQRSTLTTLFD